jgi:intron-binding protein aquarius
MGPYPSDVVRVNTVRYTPTQGMLSSKALIVVEAINSGSRPGLTVIIGPPGTGKTDVATQIISNIYHNFPEQRTLLIARSNQALNQLFEKIVALDIDDRHLLRLGHGEGSLNTEASFGKSGRVEYFLVCSFSYIANGRNGVQFCWRKWSDYLGRSGFLAPMEIHVRPRDTSIAFTSDRRGRHSRLQWNKPRTDLTSSKPSHFVVLLMSDLTIDAYFANAPQPVFAPGLDAKGTKGIADGCYRHIQKMFKELEDVRPFELLRTSRDRTNYLLVKEARIIALTSTYAAIKHREILDLGFKYDNIVMEEAAQITEIENFVPLTLQHPKDDDNPLQRIVLIGDHHQNPPVIQNAALKQMEQSLFTRLVRLGVPAIQLDAQGRARPSIADLYRWRYNALTDLPVVTQHETYVRGNAGFRYPFQFINVDDFAGQGESQPSPHFIQNLGEAEYAVAIYQYMRLLGYPAEKISILTTYAGQKALILDVLDERCSNHPLFGLPASVTTVDKYQGDQNDCTNPLFITNLDIILSLVRSKSVGYLRDIRRWIVALSRARLGLYVVGRRRLFESCPEIEQTWTKLVGNGDQLQLVSGEMWPTQRKVSISTRDADNRLTKLVK